MYCPRCGQQQVSEEVRFCPRCGLSLAAVPTLLAGVEAPAAEGAPGGGGRTRKRAQTRRGAKIMFFSAVLAPVFFALCFPFDSPVPLIVPLTVFLVGLAWTLYFVLFGEDLHDARPEGGREGLREGRGARALPPAAFVPASGFGGRRAQTADMAQPPSVTEQTTRLLDED
jgi:hypothetical protein